jgi:ATP-dependent Clp protease ATP-binding subunit ClpC
VADEHRKYIEKDAALERRFQPVVVGEPNQDEALQILGGLKERYERHHRCVYTDGALEAAVALSSRYVADRFLPDKVGSCMAGGLRGHAVPSVAKGISRR